MKQISELIDIVEGSCQALAVEGEPRGLFEPIEYIMGDGGKRLRPLITLMAANLFTDDVECALGAATAVEVFHNFTLLHDDLMDNAPVRRSRPTVHTRWNTNTAILSGDAMLVMAYQSLGTEVEPEILREFSKAALEVCCGQQLDMEFEGRDDVTLEQYLEMISLKTAVLIAAAAKMGAIAGGASPEKQEAMYNFGYNLGIAFQVQDDLLDTYGDSARFGKKIGGDIVEGKQTFLHICARDRVEPHEAADFASRDYHRVRRVYDNHGVSTSATHLIEMMHERALAYLRLCSDDKSRLEPLKEFAVKLLDREN